MSFSYNLHVDDKDYALLAFEYNIGQDAQSNGVPAGGIAAGKIRLLLDVLDDNFFVNWMFNWKSQKDGTITVNRIDQSSKFKEIKFTKAYMLEMVESFSVGTDNTLITPRDESIFLEVYQWINQHQTRMDRSYVVYCEISAQTINVDGIAHDNKW